MGNITKCSDFIEYANEFMVVEMIVKYSNMNKVEFFSKGKRGEIFLANRTFDHIAHPFLSHMMH